MKKYKKAIIIIALITISLIAIGGLERYYFDTDKDPYRDNVKNIVTSLPINDSLDRNLAIKDLNYLVKMVEKHHVSAVDGLKADVKKQYDEEVSDLPQNPTTLDVWRAASRILNKLQDGHSRCELHLDNTPKQLNVDFEKNETGLYCIFSDKEKKKVTQINGIDVTKIYDTFLEQFSYENKYYANYNFGYYLKIPERLEWLGINFNDGIDIKYEDNGQEIEKHVSFIEYDKTQKNTNVKAQEFKIDKTNNIGIFTLNTCNFNDAYKNTLKEFFSKVNENNIGNIAIDLRHNSGGNSEVIGEFIKYLNVDKYNDFSCKVRRGKYIFNNKEEYIKNEKYEDLLFNGKLYVLTSNTTFSSAMMFSVIIGDNNLGKIIGQSAGNKPCSYGDVLQYQLPNSKLAFYTTYKYFLRPDVSKESEDAQVPDYDIESSKAIEKLYEIVKG